VAYDPTAPYQAPPPSPRRRLPRWVVPVAVGWAAVLLVLAYVSAGTSEPTVREQSPVDAARKNVSAAVANLVRAGGTAVATVSEFTRVGDCSISAVRDGSTWNQTVLFYTADGVEPALLDRIATGLPAAYEARTRHSDGGSLHTLRADAGDFVGITGSVIGPGQVRLVVATGCRPGTVPPDGAESTPQPPVDGVFTALGLTGRSWRTHEVPCPSGGALRVVTAQSAPGVAPTLPSGLSTVGAAAVTARPELFAYRTGPTSVVAKLREGVLTVTSTMDCP